jgi:hypothetical protein
MPIPDKYKRNGELMAQAFGRALGFSKGGRLMKYSDGGKISLFAGIRKNPMAGRDVDRAIATNPEVIARYRRENQTPFRKGGRIMKGSKAMKRKMAKLRAMRK